MYYFSYDMQYNNCLDPNEKNKIESYLIEFIKNYEDFKRASRTHNFLLNINEIKNNIEINIIEKFVFDNAIQSIHNYNTEFKTNFTIDDFYIEFWGVPYDTYRGFHFDVDECALTLNLSNVNPCLFSSVLYLSDINRTPLLITDIKRPNTNKPYHDIRDEITINTHKNNEFLLYFPKKYKQIIFNGSDYYHGIIQMENVSYNNRYIIGNSFYLKQNQRPLYLSYFSHYSYMLWSKYKDESINMNPSECKKLLPNDLITFTKKISQIKNLTILKKDHSPEKQFNITINNTNDYNNWYYNLIKNNINVSFNFIKKTLYNELNNIKDTNFFRLKFFKNYTDNVIQDSS